MARGKKKESTLTPEEKLAQALVLESEQPYKVPENWCWTTIGYLCSFVGGGTPDKANPSYWNGDIPWASVKDIKGDRLYDTIDRITQDGLEHSASNLCEKNELILVTRIEPGKAIISQIATAINQDLKVVKSKLPATFLYRYFQTFQHKFEEKASGSTVKGITIPNVQGTMFPLPPLAEQQRIVDRIESLFAKLDEAKEKAQTVLDSFETRKAAILHKAFTGELTSKWRAENGVDICSWNRKKIGEFAEVKGGKRLPKGHALTTEKTNHPYLRIADFGEGTIDQSDLHYITDETYGEISRYIITSEDVYLSIVGSIGKSGVIPKELDGANLTENAARIISQSTLPKYLCAYLASPITQDDIQGRIRSATLGKLSLLNIKDISVPIPLIEEQAEIVRILDNLFAKEQQAKEAAEAVLEKIDLLKKSILARAFRGELGTNDPTDEPAIELLKRIL